MREWLLRHRRPFVVLINLAVTVVANSLAFVFRFDGAVPEWAQDVWWQMLPWLVAIRAVFFVPFRLYGGFWRYTGIWDLRNILGSVFSSTLVFFVVTRYGFGYTSYPRSVYLIDALLLIFFQGGLRLSRRVYRDFGSIRRDKRILIYGAGDAGEMLVRDMRNNPFYEYEPIGFVDDDPAKQGLRIHGVKVLGARAVLARIVAEQAPDALVVAMPRAEPAVIRTIVKEVESLKVPIQTLPNLRDVLNGRVSVSQIRSLSISDLLERAPVGLRAESVRGLVHGRRVMVTGAGGSIGSELCRQIAALGPSTLVLFERHENGLFTVATELSTGEVTPVIHPVVGDVNDTVRVERVFGEYRPQVVFHAAAHKHVPLMELNPCEAVKNNVMGTRTVAQTAADHEVDRFILISTDKAVNPSSVMGATKRVAELLVHAMAAESRTCFVAVRFGNVLGSSGSVVPRFLEQIRAGGPITVTHPEMRRYFMLIPEAVQLVLHAAALGQSGSVYVLDMGDQVKILDMARNLIRLSGFVPDEDIAITFIGMRPGEKLHEELIASDETGEPSAMEKILAVRSAQLLTPTIVARKIGELETLVEMDDAKAVVEKLCEIVPTFQPMRGDAAEGAARL